MVYVSFNYRLGALGFTDVSRYATAERPFDRHWGFRVNYTLGKAEAIGGDLFPAWRHFTPVAVCLGKTLS